jgi:hypothetical protein
MRLFVLIIMMSSCQLGQGAAPQLPPQPQCVPLDQALKGTKRAIAEGGIRPLALIIDDLLHRGEVSAELGALLGDVPAVNGHIGGNRLRPALGAALELLRESPPRFLFSFAKALVSEFEENSALALEFIDFLNASDERLAFVNPLRGLLTDCAEGRPLSLFLADLSGARLSCGLAGECLLRDLSALAEDPALSVALAQMGFEGQEGRQAFKLLVDRLMSATAQPGFDVDQWRLLLRQSFAEVLPESSLVRVDALLSTLDELFAPDQRRAHWFEVVACAKRHDSQRALPGLTYDLLITGVLDLPELVGQARGLFEAADSQAIFAELEELSLRLATSDSLRRPLNDLLEPLLTAPVARLMLQSSRQLIERGLITEWLALADEGFSCEPL